MLKTTITLSAAALIAAAAHTPASAQDGALDDDPYFTTLPADPYAAPPRSTDSATNKAADTAGSRVLPRPRNGQTLAYATPSTTALPGPSVPQRASAVDAAQRPVAPASLRPLSAYIEARTGWDGIRGGRRDDGALFGATAGFDRAIARFGSGHFYVGVLASIDFSTAQRANASVVRDETGPQPILTLTEQPIEEMRDIEVGARLGWRGSRFGVYLMAAIANSKREASTTTTTFAEAVDPTDANAVLFTQTSVETLGPGGMYADGLRLGAGGEARLIGPAYLHLGYRFTDDDAGTERHQVLTGVGARF